MTNEAVYFTTFDASVEQNILNRYTWEDGVTAELDRQAGTGAPELLASPELVYWGENERRTLLQGAPPVNLPALEPPVLHDGTEYKTPVRAIEGTTLYYEGTAPWPELTGFYGYDVTTRTYSQWYSLRLNSYIEDENRFKYARASDPANRRACQWSDVWKTSPRVTCYDFGSAPNRYSLITDIRNLALEGDYLYRHGTFVERCEVTPDRYDAPDACVPYGDLGAPEVFDIVARDGVVWTSGTERMFRTDGRRVETYTVDFTAHQLDVSGAYVVAGVLEGNEYRLLALDLP